MVAAQFLKLSGLSDQTLGKVKKDLYVCKWRGASLLSKGWGVDISNQISDIRCWANNQILANIHQRERDFPPC